MYWLFITYIKLVLSVIKFTFTYFNHFTSTFGLDSSTVKDASVFSGIRVTSGNLVMKSTAGSANIQIKPFTFPFPQRHITYNISGLTRFQVLAPVLMKTWHCHWSFKMWGTTHQQHSIISHKTEIIILSSAWPVLLYWLLCTGLTNTIVIHIQ